MARSLREPDVQALLDRARPGWQWEPTLLEVEGERVRASTGLAMRARLVVGLGPRRAWRVAQVVRRAGGPLSGVGLGQGQQYDDVSDVGAPVYPLERRGFLKSVGMLSFGLLMPWRQLHQAPRRKEPPPHSVLLEELSGSERSKAIEAARTNQKVQTLLSFFKGRDLALDETNFLAARVSCKGDDCAPVVGVVMPLVRDMDANPVGGIVWLQSREKETVLAAADHRRYQIGPEGDVTATSPVVDAPTKQTSTAVAPLSHCCEGCCGCCTSDANCTTGRCTTACTSWDFNCALVNCGLCAVLIACCIGGSLACCVGATLQCYGCVSLCCNRVENCCISEPGAL